MSPKAFSSYEKVKAYMLAGKAKLTIRSEKTGKHFTYKIRVSPDNPEMFFVQGLRARDYYEYLGIIKEGKFFSTRKTTAITRLDPIFTVFLWFHDFCNRKGELPKDLTVFHEGVCGTCGRTLTDPESILSGFGPECRKRRSS